MTSASDTSRGPLRITATRSVLENRFPGLGFTVDTGGRSHYEVQISTDPQLLDSRNEARRSGSNFYSSRQDLGALRARTTSERYVVPNAVLTRFARANPKPRALYFTVAAGDGEGTLANSLSIHTETAGTQSVAMAAGFTGTGVPRSIISPSLRLARADRSAALASQANYFSVDAGDALEGEDGSDVVETRSPMPTGPTGVPSASPSAMPPAGGTWYPAANGAGDTLAEGLGKRWHLPDDGHSGARNGHSSIPTDRTWTKPGRPITNGHASTGRAEARPTAGQTDALDGYEDGWEQVAQSLSANFAAGSQEPTALLGAELDELDGNDDLTWGEVPYDLAADAPPGLSPTPPAAAPAPSINAAAPLDVEAKRRIVERIASVESANSYGAINADGEFRGRFGPGHPAYQHHHLGLSYGVVQFNQDSGTLGSLLALMDSRDHALFQATFGPASAELLQVTNAAGPSAATSPDGRGPRVRPVEGVDLWEDPWPSRFRKAAEEPTFVAAQNQHAAALYIDPMAAFAGWLGLDTDRALAIVADRAAQSGVALAQRWISDTVGPLPTAALQLEAIAALGATDLRGFQLATPGLTATGSFDPLTHAALTRGLRRLGASSPIVVPGRDQLLDTLVRRSEGEPWAARLQRLRMSHDFSDIVYDLG